jgi:GNAT superfamily N-acetyltransferase
MSRENIVVNDIEICDLTQLFCNNQKSFYLHIGNGAGALLNDDNNNMEHPLRVHRIANIIDCVFSPNILWSFYNSVLDADICHTIEQNHLSSDTILRQILALAAQYKCPIRLQVKPTAIDTQQLLKRHGFFELPTRDDAFQYIDLSKVSEDFSSSSINSVFVIRELDDSTQLDCQARKSQWGYVLCESFGFQKPHIHGPFYSDVWSRVRVGPVEPVRMFIALKNDRVVGGCQISLAHGVACLFNVTTIKSERGQGIGKALSIVAIENVRKLHYRYMLLQASDMGSPVYKKLGFKPMLSYKLFVKLGTVAWQFNLLEILLRIVGVQRLQRAISMIRKLFKMHLTLTFIVITLIAGFLAILFRQ